MALKSKEWFLGRCLDEERKASALGPLSRRALDLGLKRSAKTAGHILQACGATQLFLEAHPKVKREIVESSPLEPYPLHRQPALLKKWLEFFEAHSDRYGHTRYGYNWDTLETYLTQKYGGRHSGGGGGDSLFELVMRLMAQFV